MIFSTPTHRLVRIWSCALPPHMLLQSHVTLHQHTVPTANSHTLYINTLRSQHIPAHTTCHSRTASGNLTMANVSIRKVREACLFVLCVLSHIVKLKGAHVHLCKISPMANGLRGIKRQGSEIHTFTSLRRKAILNQGWRVKRIG